MGAAAVTLVNGRWPGLQVYGERLGRGVVGLVVPSTSIIDAVVDDLTVSTTVTQTFSSPVDHDLRAVFVAPLPSRATVTSLSATVGGLELTGVFRDRVDVCAEYHDAVWHRHQDDLCVLEHPSSVAVALGTLRAGASAVVTITMVGPVEIDTADRDPGGIDADHYVWRFPSLLDPLPPADPALADRGRPVLPNGSAETAPGSMVTARLAVTGALHADRSHLLPSADGFVVDGTEAHLANTDARRVGDLSVRWSVPRRRTWTAYATVTAHQDPERSDASTVAVTVTPPAVTTVRPLDCVIAIDRSATMRGWGIHAARHVAAAILDALGPDDRFAVGAGNTTVTAFAPVADLGFGPIGTGDGWARRMRQPPAVGLHPTDTVDEAQTWLTKVDPHGRNRLAATLTWAASCFDPTADRDQTLVVITGGQAITHDDELYAALPASLTEVRVAVVAVDPSVDTTLADRISARTDTRWTTIDATAGLDDTIAVVRANLTPPALTDLAVAVTGATTVGDLPSMVVPPGAPLTMTIPVLGAPIGATVTVTGIDPAGATVEFHTPLADARPAVDPDTTAGRHLSGDVNTTHLGRGPSRAVVLVATSTAPPPTGIPLMYPVAPGTSTFPASPRDLDPPQPRPPPPLSKRWTPRRDQDTGDHRSPTTENPPDDQPAPPSAAVPDHAPEGGWSFTRVAEAHQHTAGEPTSADEGG